MCNMPAGAGGGCNGREQTPRSFILAGRGLLGGVEHAAVSPCPGGITGAGRLVIAHLEEERQA